MDGPQEFGGKIIQPRFCPIWNSGLLKNRKIQKQIVKSSFLAYFCNKANLFLNFFDLYQKKYMHIVIFENFVKSMMSCLSKLKVTPSFCLYVWYAIKSNYFIIDQVILFYLVYFVLL